MCVCVCHTLIFILNSVVDRVDSFLKLIPGEQIFAHPLLHIKQKLKIPDERTIRVSLPYTALTSFVDKSGPSCPSLTWGTGWGPHQRDQQMDWSTRSQTGLADLPPVPD